MGDNWLATPGAGGTIRTDQLASGEHVQYVKIMDGAPDGTAVWGVDGTYGTKSDVTRLPAYTAPVSGELAGTTSATQMPNVACRMVMFKAAYDNAGRVYLGASGVTKKDGTTDTTTGWELSAGEATPWLPADNLNRFYRISDNAGDDLVYLALA